MRNIKEPLIIIIVLVILGGIICFFWMRNNSSENKLTDNTVINYDDLSGMQLNILGSYHEDMVKRLAQMFEDETGCNVFYMRLPTGLGVAKLVTEKDNPTFNVYIGGTVDAHESLKHQNILVKY